MERLCTQVFTFFYPFGYLGDIQGAVKSGNDTPSKQKSVSADHGMTVLFQPYNGRLLS